MKKLKENCFIDDADWGNVLHFLAKKKLAPKDRKWYARFKSDYARYLEESRGQVTIGMMVDKPFYDHYQRIVQKYPETRRYKQWADDLMHLPLED